MSSKQNGKNREYEVAATELVDLEDFRKYMAEEEEEEAQRAAEEEAAQAPTPEPAPAAAAPADFGSTQYVSPRASAARDASAPDNAKLSAILGVVSLVPGLGLLVGPAAIAVANKQKKEISAGRANPGGLQLTNIGLYLGAVGTALSILVALYVVVS